MTEQLLQALLRQANHRGLVIAREPALLQEMHCESAPLRNALAELEESGAIEILSPAPFLVLKTTRSWSGRRSIGRENAPKTADSDAHRYSYSFHQTAIDKSKAIADEDAGEGEEELLQEILSTLGESDPATFRGVLTNYPAPAIRSVLDRIRRTPAERIRKSKTAYFRFLLTKTAK